VHRNVEQVEGINMISGEANHYNYSVGQWPPIIVHYTM